MPVTTPDYLYDLGQEILDGCEASLTDSGITVPGRTFVSPGNIADDAWEASCDQLAVQLVRIYPGFPGLESREIEPRTYVVSGSFIVRLTRCLDSSATVPSVATLNSQAEGLYTDIWCLRNNLLYRYAAKTFLSRCQNLVISAVDSFGPSGGVAGWQFLLDVQLEEA